jgi:hypothetical protein
MRALFQVTHFAVDQGVLVKTAKSFTLQLTCRVRDQPPARCLERRFLFSVRRFGFRARTTRCFLCSGVIRSASVPRHWRIQPNASTLRPTKPLDSGGQRVENPNTPFVVLDFPFAATSLRGRSVCVHSNTAEDVADGRKKHSFLKESLQVFGVVRANSASVGFFRLRCGQPRSKLSRVKFAKPDCCVVRTFRSLRRFPAIRRAKLRANPNQPAY